MVYFSFVYCANFCFVFHSAVFSDFATALQDLSCGLGADPEFLDSDTYQIFF